MIYFAYGSNMSTSVLRDRCSTAEFQSSGRLDGYELAFTLPSQRWGSHAADIVSEFDSSVWGVLWNISNDDAVVLDEWERRYDRVSVEVATDGPAANAFTYQVKPSHMSPARGLPAPEYLAHLISGAKEHRLPPEYIEMLTSLQ